MGVESHVSANPQDQSGLGLNESTHSTLRKRNHDPLLQKGRILLVGSACNGYAVPAHGFRLVKARIRHPE